MVRGLCPGQGGSHIWMAVLEESLRIGKMNPKVDEDQEFIFTAHSFIQQRFRATSCVPGTDPILPGVFSGWGGGTNKTSHEEGRL